MSRTSLHRAAPVFLGLILATFGGVCCDENLAEVHTPRLVVEPASLTFAQPPTGSNYAEETLQIMNGGEAELLITDVALQEDDAVSELVLLDADDWTSGSRQIAPGASVPLVVGWRVLDAQLDTGALTIASNGGELTVPVVTADADPEIEVLTVPEGERKPRGLRIVLTDVLAGGQQVVPVTVRSAGAAPLTIQSICVAGGAGECATAEPGRATFILCQAGDDPDTCTAPTGSSAPLLYDATSSFKVHYRPPLGSEETVVANVLIRSNAAAAPDFVITLEGTPCVRRADGDICGTCGDRAVNGEDACDDGNVEDSDACLSDCRLATCGDGILHTGEETCDDGGANSDAVPDACRTDCAPARCGDGVLDMEEACDDGGANSDAVPDACRTDCTPARCGDGVLDMEEECDDGVGNANDVPGACQTDCTIPPCGNGQVDDGEECDDGRANSDTVPDACRTNCTSARCGDGIKDSEEVCDEPLNALCRCRPDCTFPQVSNVSITINGPDDLARYANISNIDGNLDIANYPEATFDWPALDCVWGNLTVRGSTNTAMLQDLNGLRHLRVVEGNITIRDNRVLTDVSGFEGLAAVEGDLTIDNNDSLTTLQGLHVLHGTIGGDLSITANDNLTSLTGLQNITTIGGSLIIRGPSLLGDLRGLESLGSLGGELHVALLDQLLSLDGLELLMALHGTVEIFNNLRLASLRGLGGVTGEIPGDLRLVGNPALTSLEGLYGITGVRDALTVRLNVMLPQCEVEEWVTSFPVPPASTTIMSNDTAAICP